jgi:Flp pilus assembly protein TadD
MSISWDRRVVPPWSRSTDAPKLFRDPQRPAQEAQGRNVMPLADEHRLSKVLAEFANTPSIGIAADALRFALRLSIGDERLKSVATFVLQQPPGLPEGLLRTAQALIQQDPDLLVLRSTPDAVEFDSNSSIRETRRWLSQFPYDALTWLDLGRLHAVLGNDESARRAVITALRLAPNSRLVIRGASRYFLHVEDPEQALTILQKGEKTQVDPWLMAGQIAISSILGKNSLLIKQARRYVESGQFSPADVAELASSLATIELQNGSNKIARKLFNISLHEPNQNALAQVEWAAKHLNIIPDVPEVWLQDPSSAEAGYYRAIFSGNFEDALVKTHYWRMEEPFASRPMVAASFLTGISGDYDEAIKHAKQGLISEPENALLLNNLAFSYGAQGDVAQAEKIIRKICNIESKRPRAHTLANLGMLAYLGGEYELGRSLYERAIKYYKNERRSEEAAAAAMFHARFAKNVNAPNWESLVSAARGAVDETRSKLSHAIFQQLMKEAPGLDVGIVPTQPKLTRRWEYDATSNVLTFEARAPLGKT